MTTFINNYSILPRLSGLSKLKFMNFWSNDFNGPFGQPDVYSTHIIRILQHFATKL